MKIRPAVSLCVHDDACFLPLVLQSWAAAGPAFAFVSRVPWHGRPGDWEEAARAAEASGAEVVLGDWADELSHRRAAREWLLKRGFTHAMIPDGDEVVEPGLLAALLQVARAGLAERVAVEWDIYWKSAEYVIRPRTWFTPMMLIDLRAVTPVGIREYEGGRPLLLTAAHGLVHHLSYAGSDARIRRKVNTWGHRLEVFPGWWEDVWLRWDEDRLLRNLHPTHPDAYGFAERIPVPALLQAAPVAPERQRVAPGAAQGAGWNGRGSRPAVARVSVVIPLRGGEEEIRQCLESLEACRDLLHEVVVVDDASTDGAAEVSRGFDWVRVLPAGDGEGPLGFARTCNRGFTATTGELVLFLNSDTVVPRAGLEELVAAVARSGSIAAAGPYTNRALITQELEPTYTSLATLDLFAEDFAARPRPDDDTDMLVGFCLLARRSALLEVAEGEAGPEPRIRIFDERFGAGTYEDNDLCYRLRRAGYRLVRAARSWVHHHGSRTMHRLAEAGELDPGALLNRNGRLMARKWAEDLRSGFASHLSGTAPERIRFAPERHPDLLLGDLALRVARANISLCMIVRSEERVLAEALASAAPFFTEMIVVDTGSTDRTPEIARAAGARVVEFPWVDSFAMARNESLRHAHGDWVFWMDADDTLPRATGLALLHAAAAAPPHLMGFVVPVQFLEEDGSYGTRVDHVKLFRNLPGAAFEGRIHEQVLPSLRALGGSITRLGPAPGEGSEAPVVWHSGYDTSPEGQARKRERDRHLLELELVERPEHPFVLFNLGMTDHYNLEHARAIEWLRRCLERSTSQESHRRKAWALLAVSQRDLGDPAAALKTVQEGLADLPDDPELHFHAGYLLSAQGQHADARQHYEQVLRADVSEHLGSLDMGLLGYKTWHNLAQVCRLQGDYPAARDGWGRAIAAAPHFLASACELFQAAVEAGDLGTAREMLGHVARQEGGRERWARLAARLAEAEGTNPEAVLRGAAQHDPGADGPRLVLARRLLQHGRESEAFPFLQALQQRGIAEAAFLLGVSATRRGELDRALSWMERAHHLNPAHQDTCQQVDNLRRALAAPA